jgi:hypothetical protein
MSISYQLDGDGNVVMIGAPDSNAGGGQVVSSIGSIAGSAEGSLIGAVKIVVSATDSLRGATFEYDTDPSLARTIVLGRSNGNPQNRGLFTWIIGNYLKGKQIVLFMMRK